MCKKEDVTTRFTQKNRTVFTREEVAEHTKSDSKWIIINHKVYDITSFSRRHPGGARVISHLAGHDATDAWTAFHDRKSVVSKYMSSLCIGEVQAEQSDIEADFRELRVTVERMNLFQANPLFYALHLAQIIALNVIGVTILHKYGVDWISYLAATVCFVTAQAQAGWSQHDYGHLSVFSNNKLNHLAHQFVIGTLKGASSHWWNFRHFQHHAKPNVIAKDPDIDAPYIFLIGEKMARSWGSKKQGFMPYNWQSVYFHLLGPPTLLPLYFHIEVLYFIFKRKDWLDLGFVLSFFVIWFSCISPVLGFPRAFAMYMLVRFLESHWFTYVTQMSHIPMEVEKEQNRSWFVQQVNSSANVEPSYFNDWFTGHLNYQIEHHLFPTMPRHNLHKIVPLVKSLCKKHNLTYECNSLLQQFGNILRSLSKSGDIWYDAYYH